MPCGAGASPDKRRPDRRYRARVRSPIGRESIRTRRMVLSTMADDINEQINAGRKTIAMSREDPRNDPREDLEDEMEPRRVPTAMVAAGIGAAIVGLGVIGWLI